MACSMPTISPSGMAALAEVQVVVRSAGGLATSQRLVLLRTLHIGSDWCRALAEEWACWRNCASRTAREATKRLCQRAVAQPCTLILTSTDVGCVP
jgi:hypothetical protein